jgi:hypothetical protein
MTTWDERVESHPGRARLDSIHSTVSQQLADEDLEADAAPWLLRFQRALGVVHGRFQAVDPQLVSAAVLQGLDNALQQVETQLQNFVSNGNAQHLAQADPQIDAVLQASTPLLAAVPWDEREVEDLREHVTNYRRSAGQLYAALKKEADELEAELARVKAAVAETDQNHEAKLTELAQAVQEHRQNMEEALTQFRDSFSAAQDERRTAFSDLLEEQTGRIAEVIKDFESKAETQHTNTQEAAKVLIEKMETYRDQAAELVDAVGNLGTAAGYGKYASNQKRNADWLRNGAVLVVLSAVGFAIWALSTAAGDLTWQRSVAKLTVVALLGGLAAYLGRQSGVHRDREAAAKKVELELTALDPYLALMEPEQRDGVKIDIAKKLFGQPLVTDNGSKAEEPNPSAQVLALATELVKKSRDA